MRRQASCSGPGSGFRPYPLSPPTTALKAYARLGLPSAVVLLVPPLVFAFDVLADLLIDFHWVRLDFVPNPVAEMTKLYAAIIAARIYGSVLYVRGYRVDYGRHEDYRVPLLGDLQPAEAVEKQARPQDFAVDPIELGEGDGGPLTLLTTAADQAAEVEAIRRKGS